MRIRLLFTCSCGNDLPLECVRVEDDDLFSLLFRVVDRIGCAALVPAIVDGNEKITVINQVSVPDVEAAALVSITHLHDFVSALEEFMIPELPIERPSLRMLSKGNCTDQCQLRIR